MIPILYEAGEKDFTTLGLGALMDNIRPIVTEERNGLFYLEMEYPVNGVNFEELKVERIIVADAAHDLKNQKFVITRISKPIDGIVSVYADHISLYKMVNSTINNGVSYDGDATVALNAWANNNTSNSQFTVSSNITLSKSGTWTIDKYENLRVVLGGAEGSILDQYGGEYKFDNLHVQLLQSRGLDRGVRVDYGNNLVDFEQEDDISGTYTSIFPYVIIRETIDNKYTERILTLPEMVLHGKYISNYATPKIKIVEFQQDVAATEEKLRAEGQKYLERNNLGLPKVKIDISFIELAKTLNYESLNSIEDVIGMGDLLTISFPRYNVFDVKMKVVLTRWNVTTEVYESLTVGTLSTNFQNKVVSNTGFEELMESKINEVSKNVNIVLTSAEGTNRTYKGADTPIANIGDKWFKTYPDGTEELYIWNSLIWEPVITEEQFIQLKQDLDDSKDLIESAKAAADKATADAEAVTGQMSQVNVDLSNVIAEVNAATERLGTVEDDITNVINDLDPLSTDPNSTAYKLNQTKSDLDGISQTLVDYAKKTDLDGLATETYALNIAKAEAGKVSQTLASYAKTTDVDGKIQSLTENVNSQISTVEGNYTTLSQKFSQIGGRNLYPNTTSEWNEVTFSGWQAHLQVIYIGENENLKAGDTITWGGILNPTTYPARIMAIFRTDTGHYVQYHSTTIDRGETGKVIGHAVVPNNAIALNLSIRHLAPDTPSQTVKYKELKIEKGSVATDWTPAPEDIEAEMGALVKDIENVNSQISTVDGNYTTLSQKFSQIGGRNLYPNTTSEWNEVTFSGWQAHLQVIYIGENENLKAGDTITWGGILNPTTYPARIMAIFRTDTGHYVQYHSTTIDRGETGKVIGHAVVPNNAIALNLSIRHLAPDTPSQTVKYKELKIEKGSVATDWTPAPEDIEAEMGALVKDIENVNSQISTVDGNYTTLAQKVNGQVTKLTSISQTVDSQQSVIADLKGETGLMSLSNIRQSIDEHQSQLVSLEQGSMSMVEVDAKEVPIIPYYAGQFWAKGFYDFTQGYDIIKETDTVTLDEFANAGLFMAKNDRLNGSFEWDDWERVSADPRFQISDITQEIDKIVSTVYKDGLLTQINQQAGNVLMLASGDGKTSRLNLTRDGTFIDTALIQTAHIADLAVTDAKIGSLNASKIKTGTLDANIVNVINLNVSKLVGDTSTFVRSAWNAINSNLTVDGNQLVFSHTDGTKTVLDATGLYTDVAGAKYRHSYLTYANHYFKLNAPVTAPVWVTLPPIWKGRKFEVMVSIATTAGMNALGNESVLRNFSVGHVEGTRDYVNGRFQLYGICEYFNTSTKAKGTTWVDVRYFVQQVF